MIKRKKSNRKNPANFDNEKGIGWSELHFSREYDSIEVLMKPSIFLKLAYPLHEPYKSHIEFIATHIDKELPIATPFLILNQSKRGKFTINGHEGRHRTTVIKRKFGDELSKVLLIFENFKFSNKILNEINKGVLSESDLFIEGPLFKL